MLANTQPETPLAPHTTVYGPNTTPDALQRAGCVYNHRCHNRHRTGTNYDVSRHARKSVVISD